MKFEKAFVVCPECKKKTLAYTTGIKEVGDGIFSNYVSIANFCGYCGTDLRFMQKTCKKCGFTDWADVFIGDCPYCQIEEERERREP